MNNIERIDIGTEMYTSLTHQDLDDLLGKLGVGEYKRGELYWAVESENEGTLSRSEIRSMKLFRFYKPFILVTTKNIAYVVFSIPYPKIMPYGWPTI